MKLFGKRSERKRDADLGRLIAIFESDTREVETRPDPPLARATVWLLALMIVSLTVWGTFSYLDKVVSARGSIVSVEPSIVVQPLETSIIKTLKVNIGDVVRAGQELATLDPTFVQSDVSQIETRLRSITALIARVDAELSDHSFAPVDLATNPDSALQFSIWQERKTQYTAQLRQFEQKTASLRANMAGRQGDRDMLNERMKVLSQIEVMRERLAAADVGSRLNVLLANDARLEVARNLSLATNALAEAQHDLSSLQSQKEAFMSDWRSKAMAELVAARNERGNLTEQLVKAKKRGDLVRLESPVDAIVLERTTRSVGSVIKEAEPVFTLVPMNSPIEAEIRIDARDIGFVRPGDPVYIKLDAYPYIEHGMAEGEVRTISEDAFSDSQDMATAQEAQSTGMPAFYKARVRLTSTALRNVPEGFRVIPGLPLSGDVKVGSRTVVSYLLRPILRGLGESMREP